MGRRWRLFGLLSMVLVAAIVMLPAMASGKAASGQAWSAKRLSKAVRITKNAKSRMTFTIRNGSGSRGTGYAIAATKYYERGPNDSGYHRVSQAESYTVFRNWGGGGSCPAKLVYTTYRY